MDFNNKLNKYNDRQQLKKSIIFHSTTVIMVIAFILVISIKL